MRAGGPAKTEEFAGDLAKAGFRPVRIEVKGRAFHQNHLLE